MDEQKCSTKSPPRAKVRDLADEKKEQASFTPHG